MPAASPLVSGGLFVAGIVIGLGAGAAVSSSSKRSQSALPPSQPSPSSGAPAGSQPIVDLARKDGSGPFSVGGAAQGGQAREVAREVFRYGFPGAWAGLCTACCSRDLSLARNTLLRTYSRYSAPHKLRRRIRSPNEASRVGEFRIAASSILPQCSRFAVHDVFSQCFLALIVRC